jgi:tetratricopeptide (TPR) repeat protein
MRPAGYRGPQHRLLLTAALLVTVALRSSSAAQIDRLGPYRGAVALYRAGQFNDALRSARTWRPDQIRSDGSRMLQDKDAHLAPTMVLLLTELAWKDPTAGGQHLGVAEALVDNLRRLHPDTPEYQARMKAFQERWYAFVVSMLLAELNPSSARTVADRGLQRVGATARLQLLSGLAFEAATYPHATCPAAGCRSDDDGSAFNRDLRRAADAYQRAIALDGQAAEAHLRLGRVLHLLGERDQARLALMEAERLTERADRRFLIALFRAELNREEGDLRGAEAETERAVMIGPNYQSARIALAQLSDQLGLPERSRELVDELLELPNSGDPWWEFRQPAEDVESLEWMRGMVRQ